MAELRTILDSGDIETLKMGPSSQAHNEGQIFYDTITKALSFHNDIPDITLNIGHEVYMRVINNSGLTIPNGTACRHDGVDIVAGLPQVEPAIATNFVTSRVLGIASNDILDGEEGVITVEGVVNGLDTSGLTAGVPLYLSNTVAGTYISVPPNEVPDIATVVGGCLVVDALTGSIQVKIDNNTNLPNTIGALYGTNNPTYIDMGGGVDIVDYANSEDLVMAPNPTTGIIDVVHPGYYRASFSWSGTATNDQDIIYWELYDVTNAQVIYSYSNQVANNITSDGVSCAFTFPFRTTVPNNTFRIRARSTAPGQDITIERISFDIESIRIR